MNKRTLTRAERRQRRWGTVLDTATVLLTLFAVLLLMFALRGCEVAQRADAATIAATASPAEITTSAAPDTAPRAPQEEDASFPEEPLEQELIAEALLEKGYYSDAIPLSYELQDTLRWACEVNGIPYCVALGLIEHESRFNPEAVSRVGCYGLCQLNPKYFPADLDPYENIAAGMTYLGRLINEYNGDLPAALRAYNRGYDDGWRGYSNTVLAYAEAWRQVLDKD